MPRIARKDLHTNFFHIIVQGINKEYIFDTDNLIKKYQTLMLSNLNKYNVKIVSYCIMNNHAHILIYSENLENMSKYMQSINTAFAKYYNKEKNRVGVVFRNRYESEPILNLTYLYNCIVYIHKNPVKAKMVASMCQYKYSSYNDYIMGNIDKDVLDLVFGTQKAYMETFMQIHKNYNEQDFKDYIEDIDYEKQVKELLNINVGDLMINEKMLNNKVKELVLDYKVPISELCNILNLTRYKILKILKK